MASNRVLHSNLTQVKPPPETINMKFAVVVVLLALALGIESHVLTYGHISPLSYTAVSGPSFYSAPAVYGSPYPTAYAAHGGFVNGHLPIVSAYNSAVVAPAPIVAAPVIAGEGSYVAQTRGSVHVAPLPGHVNSAASINLEPAPGTL